MALNNNEKKLISSLNTKKYRQKSGYFMIEGVKMVQECLDSKYQIELMVVSGSFVAKNKQKLANLQKNAKLKGYKLIVEKDKEFNKLSTLDTPAGILATIKIPKPNKQLDLKGDIIVLLDKVMDPGNLGTIIRTADWYGLKQVIISKDSVDLYNPKVIQATMGSIFHLEVIKEQDLIAVIKNLKKENYKIYSTDLKGNENGFEKKQKVGLVLGSESHGVRQEVLKSSDKLIKIKRRGKAESLNVAVSAGIILDRYHDL